MRRLFGCAAVAAWLAATPAAAFEAVSGLSYYMDEPVGRLLLLDLPGDIDTQVLRADITRAGEGLVRDAAVVAGRQLWVGVPVSGLPLGDSRLTVRLRADGRAVGTAAASITRRAPRANAVQVDRLSGGLIVGGMPLFPFGFYCDLPVQPALAEQGVARGFNSMSPYRSNDPASLDERRAYMDRAAELGLKVHYQLPSAGSHQAWLRGQVETFRDHPALLAWHISDEPVQDSYRIVRDLDPYHPITAASRLSGAVDVAMADTDPIPHGNVVAGAVRTVLDGVSPHSPVWLAPQAVGGDEPSTTAARLRLQTWLGVIEGGTGVQQFARHRLSGAPSRTALEVAALTPHLLSGQPRPTVTSSEETVRAAAWRHEGEVVIAAVNTDSQPLRFELRLPGADYDGADVEVMYEDRTVAVRRRSRVGLLGVLFRPVGAVTGLLLPGGDAGSTDLRFADLIDAYGVRLYRLPAPLPPAATPLSVLVDPSFEWDAAPSAPAAVYADLTQGRGATCFVDSRLAWHGRRSLRLHTPRDGEGVMIRPHAPSVTPGRTYRFALRARSAAAPGASPVLRLQNAASGDSADFELSPRWERYALDGVIGDGVTRDRLSVALATAGTAWIDLLELYDISPRIRVTPSPVGHEVTLESVVAGSELRMRLDGGEPGPADALYSSPFRVSGSTTVRAAVVRDGLVISRASLDLYHHGALGRFVDLAKPFSPRYSSVGPGALTDGVLGTDHFDDGRWQGFEGQDLQAVIDLGAPLEIASVSCRFLQNAASRIWLPTVMEVNLSDDGRRFRPFATADHDVEERTLDHLVEELVAAAAPDRARYVRIRARTVGVCPDWHASAGSRAWVFADEIRVNPER